MKIRRSRRLLRGAASGALLVLMPLATSYAADDAAQDPAITALTKPTSSVEIGVGDVSKASAKFGEYNGLEKKGAFVNGNIDLRGGENDTARRWRINGSNLGLENRSLSAEYGEQGSFRLNFGYDELLHNITDTYQTPYVGAGSNALRLPAGWITPIVPQISGAAGNFRALDLTAGTGPFINGAGVVTNPSAANLTTLNNIRNADVPKFQNFNLGTKRTKYDFGAGYNFNALWDIQVGFRHENKDGAKPMSTVALQNGTAAVVIPDLISQTTDQFNAGLNFRDEKSFLQLAYYGSIFRNAVKSMSWENPFLPGTVNTMSSAPSNQFHQFSLSGGYNFSKTTRLSIGGSYARNTQNDSFLNNPTDIPLGLPASSANALVVTKAFNAKLTSKPFRDWNFAANYRYNDRDNRTPVNTYAFYDAGEAKTGASVFNAALGLPAGTLGSNINIYANRPYSKTSNQLNLDGDYKVTNGQALKFGYDRENIDRYCSGSWINCADARRSNENTLRAEWRGTLREDLTGKVGFGYATRKVNYDPNAWLSLVPMANVVPAGATQSVYQTLTANGIGGIGFPGPFTPLAGNLQLFFPNNSALQQAFYGSRNDIHELNGMQRFNMADRNRDKLKSTLNWEATDRLSLQAGFDWNKDAYSNSVYGLQRAKSSVLNFDGTYKVSEDFSFNAFFSHEDQRSRSAGDSYSAGALSNAAFVGLAADSAVQGGCFNTVLQKNLNAKVDPCLNWSTDMRDRADTLGFGVVKRGLMGGKLGLRGDLIFTRARTDVNVMGGTYANNPFALAGAPAVNPAVIFIPAGPLPTVSTKTLDLRLNGEYALDKASAIRLIYWLQHVSSSDYSYAGMQFGTLNQIMPTNQQAPNYNVHVVSLSYLYRFQ